MLTDFGRLVRKIRIDQDMSLGSLAEKIEVSSAYLSAVETGKKKLTSDLVEKVISALRCDKATAQQLRSAGARTTSDYRINVGSQPDLTREAVAMFARKIETAGLSRAQAEQIMSVLNPKEAKK